MSASTESDPIVVSYHDSIVRTSNLKTLDDANWLDDNIINFAFEYVQYDSQFTQEMTNVLAFVSPPVVQLVKMSDDLFAEQILQSIDFLDKQFVILPLNDNQMVNAFAGSHWSLLILAVQEKTLYHFDSASSANDRTAKALQSKFCAFFHESVPLVNTRCPQQKNGFDCGLYLIAIVEEFCRFVHAQGRPAGKEYFEKFTNEIHRSVTPQYINQRRKQLKTLLQSMSSQGKQ